MGNKGKAKSLSAGRRAREDARPNAGDERWMLAFLSVYMQCEDGDGKRLSPFRRPEASLVVRARDAMLKMLPEKERVARTFYASREEVAMVAAPDEVRPNDTVFLRLPESSGGAPAGWYRALVLLYDSGGGYTDGERNAFPADFDPSVYGMLGAVDVALKGYAMAPSPLGLDGGCGMPPQLSQDDVMRCLLSERRRAPPVESAAAATAEEDPFDMIDFEGVAEALMDDAPPPPPRPQQVSFPRQLAMGLVADEEQYIVLDFDLDGDGSD